MKTEFKEASRGTLDVGGTRYTIFRLGALSRAGLPVERLPFSLRVLLENLLRHEDGRTVRAEDIRRVAARGAGVTDEEEIAFRPGRVLLQDFTGVPVLVDLAAMRDAMAAMGGDPLRINPLQPVDLVIDHSVQVDVFARPDALAENTRREMARNGERYRFLRWGQGAFANFRAVPPGTGIVHQVNLEYLASVVTAAKAEGGAVAYPDTLVGTDSHTTMVNGAGVLGWGVGGIEAEAAMLGQPISMLVPEVVGVELRGRLPEGTTGTDLVLTVTEMLRKHGVVGKFVEFFGDGLDGIPLAGRATVANMAPEYGATAAYFPVDEETLNYLRFTGREESQVRLVEAYAREQGLFRTAGMAPPRFSATLALDLSSVVPSLAGPRRPQDRVALSEVKESFRKNLAGLVSGAEAPAGSAAPDPGSSELSHGSVVIAAITSCTNTSNPEVLIAAGLLARKAVARGLARKPWVKTSLAPGSRVVTDYLKRAGLDRDLDALGFQLVGYGCTTCIGNSGPLPEAVARAVEERNLVVASVLSGNRNFEGRINPHVRANYLASPPLVVAYALAGRMDLDLTREPLGEGRDGRPVYLRDLWPTSREIEETMRAAVRSEMFRERYANVFAGEKEWRELDTPAGTHFHWEGSSTYIRKPPYFEGLAPEPEAVADIRGARLLALLGDSVTTDHISPAGSIKAESPAGLYLREHGVAPAEFNSYGARRGNDEVMVRGTFANIRLRNLMAPGSEGGVTVHLPDGERTTIYDAAMRYAREGVPLIVVAGAEYGTGSSRDWAAKGTRLLGVRAVIAVSFERIHRSNLVGMGVLPLEFADGATAASLGLDGRETYEIRGIGAGLAPKARITVKAAGPGGRVKEFPAVVRIDTPVEMDYYRHGGILPYVLRQLLKAG